MTPADALDDFLRNTRFDPADPAALGKVLGALVDYGCDRAPFVPLPGHGQTLARWRALAAVAACDLGLVKLFEGHTDALAILAELDGPAPPAGSRWAVWAAEPPDARVQAAQSKRERSEQGDSRDASEARDTSDTSDMGGMGDPSVDLADSISWTARSPRVPPSPPIRLTGTKAWCSGAAVVSHALVTVWLNGEPVLAAVEMDHPSIAIDASKWQAVGMQATASADVTFNDTPAILLGGPHAYVRRPGFWQGGAGIAACWYGAAARIGQRVREGSTQRADAHRLAHLGAIEVALASAASVLRESAAWIDANPLADAHRIALRARLVVEEAATTVMQHATRALGAGPLCRDARFARALADLPVFVRQSHAERDLAALGELAASSRGNGAAGDGASRVNTQVDGKIGARDGGEMPWTL
ncbi:acyl-CoA/acyl-ACP dehydrogenase [Paraburkholderia sp. D15]|uniref:acyl-CoA dehydrogenase family protein n=1 Tax=Paraburkholderia sp. D15 TaxID=2880218 RepID=UPI002478B558|nr:acyl-CoA dehydrogenase family protein [Paraburkholderia sp. D15]WGS51782.1 acyl-CoA/acyl-ACP dehydrogenase [Paraburkholderia sp. D15]